MRLSIRTGEPFGLPVMKFTLVYDGSLKSNGNPTKKQEIRDKLHPQLADLWKTNPCLKLMKERRYIDLTPGGFAWFENHHSIPPVSQAKPTDGPFTENGPAPPYVDLLEPVLKSGVVFLPLVRERTALCCTIKITFLRNEPPGKIYQGGDIDNRLKTLLDALSVLQHDDQVVQGCVSPIFCLLEDDSLITGIEVQTDRLLGRPELTAHDVHLLIEVDIRVTNPRGYNQMFLGD